MRMSVTYDAEKSEAVFELVFRGVLQTKQYTLAASFS